MGGSDSDHTRPSSRLPRACRGSHDGSPGSGRAGEVGRDDVGGVAVEGAAGAVVAAGLAWVGMTCEVLDVTQAAAGIERGGDGGVPERVGRDALVDAGSPREPAHDPARGVPVESAAVGTCEQGSIGALTDGGVDGSGGPWREGMRAG